MKLLEWNFTLQFLKSVLDFVVAQDHLLAATPPTAITPKRNSTRSSARSAAIIAQHFARKASKHPWGVARVNLAMHSSKIASKAR